MKIALFGGTFDPIHTAHLVVAREAVERFGLARLLLVPAANPPHKQQSASYEHRYRMVELASQGQPALEASRLEAGAAKSYTYETLRRVRDSLQSSDELHFVIGADAFGEIGTWHRWQEVLGMTEFIVVTRPGHAYAAPPGAVVHRLETVALPVSSSEIRERLARGESPRELPAAVLHYIQEHGLYRDKLITSA